MLKNKLLNKLFRIIYGIILPIIVIVLFIGIASFNSRLIIFHSIVADFVIRLFISIWFCCLYFRLSIISSFSFFPNKKWSKKDVGNVEKYFYIGLTLLFGIGCGIITYWLFIWFLPSSSQIYLLIAIFNGLIISLPLLTHYWVLKLSFSSL
jgi:hypothetical protein